ncbi:hypothetical protein OGAPHI_004774 [Ogataea philodendri]|uniref:PI31 proteasome regulator C-terminal domain-containing protein n=1 Tax=Ogataea philodendri TaxID=1378263 RepID=A0A9P8P2U1_9ASCO|nr:uncharacterized protein OGAPHI_004774 [Ogataea philodendri]KAH3664060.1 hypothetical protein OGAPHI_004774 [Ogataea philodendri]
MGSIRDNLDLIANVYKRFLASRNINTFAIDRNGSQISLLASEGKFLVSLKDGLYTLENTTKDVDGTPLSFSASLAWPDGHTVNYPVDYDSIDPDLLSVLISAITRKLGPFLPEPVSSSQSVLQESVSRALPPSESQSAPQLASNVKPSPALTAPAPKPLPSVLAPPRFEDEHQIQSDRTSTVSAPAAQSGTSDLYPGGIKDPILKPYLDPLAINGTQGGGMHPTASDPMFGGRLPDPRHGIRYSDPLMGPDDDPELLGAGLPGHLGLPGQGFNRPRGPPGPPGSFGGGFNGFI